MPGIALYPPVVALRGELDAVAGDLAATTEKMVKVPQLFSVPVSLWGHSQTVLAGWTSTGWHWSSRLPGVTGSGALTNYGVGGYRMEDIAKIIDANPAGGYGAYDWPDPVAAKTLALVMCVLNSASEEPVSRAQSVESMKLAARMIAATVLCDTRIPAVHGANGMVLTAGWGAFADAMGCNGTIPYSATNGDTVKATWTPAMSAAMCWLVTFCGNSDGANNACQIRVTVNGVERYAGVSYPSTKDPQPSSAVEVVDYMKIAIPIGPIVAGQPVVAYKTAGPGGFFFFDGYLPLGAKHHVAFTKDPAIVQNGEYPMYVPAAITAHNAALDELATEFNAFAPGSVSALDLEDLDMRPYRWSGDNLHWDDQAQDVILARLSQQARAVIPWTPRLHTL